MTRRQREILWNIWNATGDSVTIEKATAIFKNWLKLGFIEEGPIDYEELSYCMEKEAFPEFYD